MRERMSGRSWYKNKRFAGLVILVLVILVAVILQRGLSGAANGSVNNSANFEASQTAPAPQAVKGNGKYISFEYPDSFRITPSQQPLNPQLENFNYVTKKSPFWQLAIGVSTLPSNNLADYGPYTSRLKNSAQYKLSSWDVNGQKIPVFSDELNPYSKAAFALNQGKLTTIALSGSGDGAQLDSTLQQVLTSLRWKE